MKKHIIKEEDILAEDKRFSEFENQDIINEFENKFVVDGKPEWIGCNIPTKLLKDFLQKAISQTEKETRERVIREIEEKLPKEKILNPDGILELSEEFINGWNDYRERVKFILNQSKVVK